MGFYKPTNITEGAPPCSNVTFRSQAPPFRSRVFVRLRRVAGRAARAVADGGDASPPGHRRMNHLPGADVVSTTVLGTSISVYLKGYGCWYICIYNYIHIYIYMYT